MLGHYVEMHRGNILGNSVKLFCIHIAELTPTFHFLDLVFAEHDIHRRKQEEALESEG